MCTLQKIKVVANMFMQNSDLIKCLLNMPIILLHQSFLMAGVSFKYTLNIICVLLHRIMVECLILHFILSVAIGLGKLIFY